MKERDKREYLNLCKFFGIEFMEITIGVERYSKERKKYTQLQMIESLHEINNLNK